MNDNKLAKELEYCSKASKIIIGFSGGADSVTLTHVLYTAFGADKLICAHVNHMIRGAEADRDENFVRNFCESRGIELKVLKKDIPVLAKELNMGSEEAGRKVRYEFFDSLLTSPSDIICTAHNADDNAETVIMNIIRGSGLHGISGIPQIRGRIYRPILKMTRAEIEEYCKANSLDYVTDSTNLGDEYNRNIVRHHILPYMKQINIAAVKNISKLSELVSRDDIYIDSLADNLITNALVGSGYKVSLLSESDNTVLSRAVIKIISKYTDIAPGSAHIDDIINIIRFGGAADIPGKIHVESRQGVLTLSDKEQKSEPDKVLNIGFSTVFYNKTVSTDIEKLEKGKKINNLLFYSYADYDKITNALTVGSRKSGDSFTFSKRKISKSLKKVFNEKKIPTVYRDKIVVIRDGDKIVFVEGLGVNAQYAVTENTVNALKFTVKSKIQTEG